MTSYLFNAGKNSQFENLLKKKGRLNEKRYTKSARPQHFIHTSDGNFSYLETFEQVYMFHSNWVLISPPFSIYLK